MFKITLTVCAIVTSFTITQAPSAIVMLLLGFMEIGGPAYKVHMVRVTSEHSHFMKNNNIHA